MGVFTIPVARRSGGLFVGEVFLCRETELWDRQSIDILDFRQLRALAKAEGLSLPEARKRLPDLHDRLGQNRVLTMWSRSLHLIRCRDCGEPFVGKLSKFKRCGACRETLKPVKRRGPTELSLMRAEARASLRCLRCEKPVAASRSTRKYCSESCRQLAYRDRRHPR
jgi:hypothetical protein